MTDAELDAIVDVKAFVGMAERQTEKYIAEVDKILVANADGIGDDVDVTV